MSGLIRFWRSSIGAKVTMAITGIFIVFFLIAHMLGNLQMFVGPEAVNSYAYFLKHKIGKFLWVMRGGLLLAIVLHIWAAIRVTIHNREVGGSRYAVQNYSASTYASRTMIWGGIILFTFIVYHILHFTVGLIKPEFYNVKTAEGLHDVYRMTVLGFQNPWIAGWYILAQIFLWMHLKHGISSFFQTMGWNSRKYRGVVNALGPILSTIICLGFISVPLAVQLGIIQ